MLGFDDITCDGGCGKVKLLKMTVLFALISNIVLTIVLGVLISNANSLADVSILYATSQGTLSFTNSTNGIEVLTCDDVVECSSVITDISSRAKNIIVFTSILNLTQTPTNSIYHYSYNTIYIAFTLVFLSIFLNIIVFFSSKAIEKKTMM